MTVAFGLRRIVELLAILLIIAVLIVSSSAQMVSMKSIDSYGVIEYLPWLHVEGQWIVDEKGNRVALRGGGGSYTAYDGWDNLEKYMQDIKAVGGNCYRLAFNPPHRANDTWAAMMTTYNPADMDRTLALCEKYGLYAILDCHQWQGTGDPSEWQLLPNYKDYWIQIWVEIATRYVNRSVVAGYELCNEAWSYANMAIQCMQAIRQVDTKHIFFVIEAANTPWQIYDPIKRRTWNQNQIYNALGETQVVYTIHHWLDTRTAWMNATTNLPIAYCAASTVAEAASGLRSYYNAPVIVGETGVYNYTPTSNDAEQERELIRQLDAAGVGWWWWMMEKVVSDFKKSLKDFVPYTYTSSYYGSDIPKPFAPKPFNLLERIVNHGRQAYDYNYYGAVYYQIPGPDAWIEIEGPCTVLVREWQNAIWWGNLTAEYLVHISENQTQMVSFQSRKEILAYSD